LWKKIFFVKRHCGNSGPYIVGGVGFVVRKEAKYFNFPMKESVQGWRQKWFYLRDQQAPNHRFNLLKFLNVLEAKPKKTWRNILTTEEKPATDELYE
jgi:preprotein translocase subunit Sss1